jgi:Glycosyl transferase family 11
VAAHGPEPVIVTRLAGGLGNQMFEYAVGRSLALRRNTELHLDLSWFEHILPSETPRRYALAPYQLGVRLDGWEHVAHRAAAGYGPLGRVIRRLGLEVGGVLIDRAKGFRSAVLDAPDGTLLIGHWQSEQYFADVADTLRSDLTLPHPPSGRTAATMAEVMSSASVSVHVRRGDYVAKRNVTRTLGILSADYYRRAVQLIAESVEGVRVFVFSDDPRWSRAHLDVGHPTIYVANEGDTAAHEDLRLMAACRHHVIANSSFSWWGAWLDDSPDKIVVAPRRWLLDGSRLADVHAAGWIRI